MEIASTLDESKYTNHLSHVIHSIKIIDIGSRDPSNALRLVSFQNRNLSYVFECYLMKDTKYGYIFFKDFFE